MYSSDKILSICIPTRGRSEILINTLKSIYLSDVSHTLYEVVIYDSSDSPSLAPFLKTQFNVENLRYIKGENFGYMNLIHALKLGSGKYLKMHNDYSNFIEGSLEFMINEIKTGLPSKPFLLFSNGSLTNVGSSTQYTFNDFLFNVSFYNTWSNIFGIWKTDLDTLSNLTLNPMFPHTSLLLALDKKDAYKINDNILFTNKSVLNKGGYNLFHVFANDYLGMVHDCYKSGKITAMTFEHIKKDMYYNFFIPWYFETKILKNEYTFSLTGIKDSMKIHYSEVAYYKMVFYAYLKALKKYLKQSKIIKFIYGYER